MKNRFMISMAINILFLIVSGYVISTKGGVDYVKAKLNIQTSTQPKLGYSPYYKAKKSIFEIMPKETNDIIFFGSSITMDCDWNELFENPNIKNRGLSGDNIGGMINRLHEIVERQPKMIFLEAGVNDLQQKRATEQILKDYDQLIISIREKSPRTILYIQSVLPTDNRWNLQSNDVMTLNNGLMKISSKHNLIFVNLFDLLKTKGNKLDTAYTFDGIHLNGNGYLIWKKAIEEYMKN